MQFVNDLLMTSFDAFGLLVDFLVAMGLWGESFLFKFGLPPSSSSAPSYSSIQDEECPSSTNLDTLGESGSPSELGKGVEVEFRGKISNFPGGADTGRWLLLLGRMNSLQQEKYQLE